MVLGGVATGLQIVNKDEFGLAERQIVGLESCVRFDSILWREAEDGKIDGVDKGVVRMHKIIWKLSAIFPFTIPSAIPKDGDLNIFFDV